ncbi:MAG: helix-hairpin-helix domain-containing protein [Acidimicrobiaceae bacterium]|nr:helix-hairpin-helix domain-containing protein [Acidimicrobiaceae bacterium]
MTSQEMPLSASSVAAKTATPSAPASGLSSSEVPAESTAQGVDEGVCVASGLSSSEVSAAILHPNTSKSRLLTPTEIADRLGVSVPAVIVGAACLLASLLGGWWALRSPTVSNAELILPEVGSISAYLSENTFSDSSSSDTVSLDSIASADRSDVILVHVAGEVVYPGVHELLPDSRVVDAVEAAGGLTDTADVNLLNLAEPLIDGIRLWIPEVGETNSPEVVSVTAGVDTGRSSANVSGVEGSQKPKININTADAVTLQLLPGIGPSLADAIVDHRTHVGRFIRVEDLEAVPGIGLAKMEKIRPLINI